MDSWEEGAIIAASMRLEAAQKALRALVDRGCPHGEGAEGGTKYDRCYWCHADLFEWDGPGGYGDPRPFANRDLSTHDEDCPWRLAVEAVGE